MDYVAEDENDLNQGLLTFEQKRVLSETRIAVKLVEMTRLIAHDQNGTPVYSPIEAPVLSLYANFAGAFKHLEPMTEGQTVSLASMNTVSVPSPGYGGSLVLIFG